MGRFPHFRFYFVAAIYLLSGSANAAPAQLYGKSIVVSWVEHRVQKFARENLIGRPGGIPPDGVISFATAASFEVYVSAGGKIFDRLSYSSDGYRGGRFGAKSDQVGGSAERGVSRLVQFEGQTMSMTQRLQGGARRVQVRFESGFSGCSAEVLTGKESNASKITVHGLRTSGAGSEIQSVKTLSASCKIQSGNVFGN